jgi:hypothetical protein
VHKTVTNKRDPAWQKLGQVAPRGLLDARLQLHWAAQIVSAAGYTFLEAAPDDSHTNLGWHANLGALVGRPIGRTATEAALRLGDLSLLLTSYDEGVLGEVDLTGHTLDEGYEWLAAALDIHSGGALRGPLKRRDYEMPRHPVEGGERFALGTGDPFWELARWYRNAHNLLEELQSATPHASAIRCWPHHFDIAILITLDTNETGDPTRSVSVGMTPGDSSYAEPYWYVTPWPYPENPKLPKLEGGHWHTEGWLGATLTGSEVVQRTSSDAQVRAVAGFLHSAVEGARSLLG